jgi:hypothetical protein
MVEQYPRQNDGAACAGLLRSNQEREFRPPVEDCRCRSGLSVIGRRLIGGAPNAVSGQPDVLPVAVCDIRYRSSLMVPPWHGSSVYLCVPKDDGRERGDTEELVLKAAVADLAEQAQIDSTGQRVARFVLVEPEMGAASEVGDLDPIKREQHALDSADLAQRPGKPILARIGRHLFLSIEVASRSSWSQRAVTCSLSNDATDPLSEILYRKHSVKKHRRELVLSSRLKLRLRSFR